MGTDLSAVIDSDRERMPSFYLEFGWDQVYPVLQKVSQANDMPWLEILIGKVPEVLLGH